MVLKAWGSKGCCITLSKCAMAICNNGEKERSFPSCSPLFLWIYSSFSSLFLSTELKRGLKWPIPTIAIAHILIYNLRPNIRPDILFSPTGKEDAVWIGEVRKAQEAGTFGEIVKLPNDYVVLDLSSTSNFDDGQEADETRPLYTVGKYDEDRRALYQTDLFKDTSHSIDGYLGQRTIHIGLDIGGPALTPVFSFSDCVVIHVGYNPDRGDYGHVVVTAQEIENRTLFALYGHLSKSTLKELTIGQQIPKAGIIGWMGDRDENGGWPPHVHFQLGMKRPRTHDMPGVVSLKDRVEALRDYPDPRIVLGNLYA